MSQAISHCIRFVESLDGRLPAVGAPLLSSDTVQETKVEANRRRRAATDRLLGRTSREIPAVIVRGGLSTKPFQALKDFDGRKRKS